MRYNVRVIAFFSLITALTPHSASADSGWGKILLPPFNLQACADNAEINFAVCKAFTSMRYLSCRFIPDTVDRMNCETEWTAQHEYCRTLYNYELQLCAWHSNHLGERPKLPPYVEPPMLPPIGAEPPAAEEPPAGTPPPAMGEPTPADPPSSQGN